MSRIGPSSLFEYLIILKYYRIQVLVFAERKRAVDKIHEYLLLKGVECAAIHGGKDQEDRMSACKAFRGGDKDVLGSDQFKLGFCFSFSLC